MADKTVGELPRASTVTTTDLFVLEQAGQAKSLTGQVLINDLAKALDGHGGIKSITLNDDYTLTFIMSDDTEVQTTSVRGAPGAKGDKGTDGRAITSIEKIDTTGLVDTYKISFSDNTSVNFTVTNGASIKSIAKTSTSGLTDTYTVTLTDDTTSTFTVTNGNGIASITLQSGTHAAGTTDTYKITFTNEEYTTFSVYNGMNGTGSVVTVNDKNPDASGNVALTAADIPYTADGTATVKSEIDDRQMDTKNLDAETELADGDAFPFYDVSEGINRKTLWSNIVAKLKNLFLPLTGGTVAGKIKNTYASGSGIEITHASETDCGLSINKTTSSKGGAIFVGVGSSGNAGIYDSTLGKWIVHTDGTTTHVDNALPLTGGTVTGPIWVKRATDAFVAAQNATNNFRCLLEAWDNNVGLYLGHLNKWLINHDGTNVNIDGSQYRHIYVGTSETPPSDWKPGDIYFQYEA